MIYNYYLQSSFGRPMKCPEEHVTKYFDTLESEGAVDRRVAEGVLHCGFSIHVKHCRFFALPSERLNDGIAEQTSVQ